MAKGWTLLSHLAETFWCTNRQRVGKSQLRAWQSVHHWHQLRSWFLSLLTSWRDVTQPRTLGCSLVREQQINWVSLPKGRSGDTVTSHLAAVDRCRVGFVCVTVSFLTPSSRVFNFEVWGAEKIKGSESKLGLCEAVFKVRFSFYRLILQLLDSSKLAFQLKKQYLNNYKRYHHYDTPFERASHCARRFELP